MNLSSILVDIRVTGAENGVVALFLGFLVEMIFVMLFSIVFAAWKVCKFMILIT